MNPSYHPVPPSASAPPMMSPVPGSATYTMEGRNLTVLRSTSSTPEMRSESIRTSVTMSQQYPPAYQIVSPPLQASHHASSHSAITSVPQHVVVTSQHSLNARRDAANDPRHPLSRPNPIERRWLSRANSWSFSLSLFSLTSVSSLMCLLCLFPIPF